MEGLVWLIWHLGKSTVGLFLVVSACTTTNWLWSHHTTCLTDVMKWSTEKRYRLLKMVFHLVSSILLTSVSIAYCLECTLVQKMMGWSPVHTLMGIASFVVTAMTGIKRGPENSHCKRVCWLILSIGPGLIFAYFGGKIATKTALLTFGVLLLSTGAAFLAPTNFHRGVRRPIAIFYPIVGISTLFSAFIEPPLNTFEMLLITTNFFGGITLYFALCVVNVQQSLSNLDDHKFDSMYNASIIYLSTVNLYLRIALYTIVDLTSLTHCSYLLGVS